jgi:hypothetical protein
MNKLLSGGMAVAAAVAFLPIMVSTSMAHADKCQYTSLSDEAECQKELNQLRIQCDTELAWGQTVPHPTCDKWSAMTLEGNKCLEDIDAKQNPNNGAVSPRCEHGYNPNTCNGGFH